MKLTAKFTRFLENEVNLNPHRIETLTDRVETIEEFLRNSDWIPTIERCSPQGSWAHGTIIKPPGSKGFDADLIVFVDPVPGWSAADYIADLRRVFRASGTYRDITVLGKRCVTLEYAGDFSLDVVPCVVGRPGGIYRFEVCNRETDEFEPTDSEEFTAWVDRQGRLIGGNTLRETIRLLKYLRDIKQTFSCKSVLLTTLVAGRLHFLDSAVEHMFADVPSTLKILVARLDEYLQQRPEMHEVTNPVLSTEHFTRHWDEDKYANFREMIHKYNEWIHDAYDEGNEDESLAKWRRVFGDGFGGGDKAITAAAKAAIVPLQLKDGQFGDAVDAVSSLGTGVLAYVKPVLPWVKPAPWRTLKAGITPSIRATLHRKRYAPSVGPVSSGDILDKGMEVRFEAFLPNGTSFAANKDFNIQWQVVNTDKDAMDAGGLRGGFYESTSWGCRWETTQYRGIHWVEAYVIRKRDKACLGQSERFFVVIG